MKEKPQKSAIPLGKPKFKKILLPFELNHFFGVSGPTLRLTERGMAG